MVHEQTPQTEEIAPAGSQTYMLSSIHAAEPINLCPATIVRRQQAKMLHARDEDEDDTMDSPPPTKRTRYTKVCRSVSPRKANAAPSSVRATPFIDPVYGLDKRDTTPGSKALLGPGEEFFPIGREERDRGMGFGPRGGGEGDSMKTASIKREPSPDGGMQANQSIHAPQNTQPGPTSTGSIPEQYDVRVICRPRGGGLLTEPEKEALGKVHGHVEEIFKGQRKPFEVLQRVREDLPLFYVHSSANKGFDGLQKEMKARHAEQTISRD